jgi:thiamine biosynthesis lipoprotein
MFRVFLLITFSMVLSACRQPKTTHRNTSTPPEQHSFQRFSYQENLMGTRFSILFFIENTSDAKKRAALAAKEAFQQAAAVNAACSDYDVTSELMRLNADLQKNKKRSVPLSPILCDVLHSALTIAKKTNGAYDPTLGHHSYNWRMARKKEKLPTPEAITYAKQHSGWQHLHLDITQKTLTSDIDHLKLDLGGIAKGYAADQMLATLKRHGITRASITAGGEVRLGDPPPNQKGWNITLKTLDTQHRLSPETINLSHCAISTSGDLYQSITIKGQRYSHIVNPATGLGLTSRISATVIAPNATLSDALATAYCVRPSLVHSLATNLPDPHNSNTHVLIIQIDTSGNLSASGHLPPKPQTHKTLRE